MWVIPLHANSRTRFRLRKHHEFMDLVFGEQQVLQTSQPSARKKLDAILAINQPTVNTIETNFDKLQAC
jgi:hypothetical protein